MLDGWLTDYAACLKLPRSKHRATAVGAGVSVVGGCARVGTEYVNMHARDVCATPSATSVAFTHLAFPASVRTAGIGGSSTATLLKFRLQCTLLSTQQLDPAAVDPTVCLHNSQETPTLFSSPRKPEDSGGVLAIPRHERKAARRTRSFRRRQAPITKGQRRQMRELWPQHGLPMDYKQRHVCFLVRLCSLCTK